MNNVNNKRWQVKVIDAQGDVKSQWTGYAPNKMFARSNASADGHRLRIGDRYTVSILATRDMAQMTEDLESRIKDGVTYTAWRDSDHVYACTKCHLAYLDAFQFESMAWECVTGIIGGVCYGPKCPKCN